MVVMLAGWKTDPQNSSLSSNPREEEEMTIKETTG